LLLRLRPLLLKRLRLPRLLHLRLLL